MLILRVWTFLAHLEIHLHLLAQQHILWIYKTPPFLLFILIALEHTHFIMGNMICTSLVVPNQPIAMIVKDIFSAVAFGLRASVHGVLKYSPGQLVFGTDMMLRTQIQVDTHLARARRQTAIAKNNFRENKRRVNHTYHPGDRFLIIADKLNPKLTLHDGPYTVTHFNQANGTIHYTRRNFTDKINIRLVRPYFRSNLGGE